MFKEVVTLAAWNIWKQRNRRHFDRVALTLLSWKRGLTSDPEILKFSAKPENQTLLETLITSLQA